MLDGKARVFFALGGNFAAATPDTYETWKALQRCDLTVHVTTKLNRSHIVHGREALILPCLGRTEIDMQAAGPQGVTVEDSMSMVHISVGINPPASEHLLSEPAIVARLAAATLGARSRVPWLWLIEDYARIRDKIEQVFADFKDFNQRIAVPGAFACATRPASASGTPRRTRPSSWPTRCRRTLPCTRPAPAPATPWCSRCSPRARTTSTTPPSTATTIATGASMASAAWSSSTPRTSARWA